MFPFVRAQATGSPHEIAIMRAREELIVKTCMLRATFRILPDGQWGADLTSGMIAFETSTHLVSGCIQVIGTLSPAGVWRWSWDDGAIPGRLTDHAIAVRRFGMRHSIATLIAGRVEANEAEAWDNAALAMHLSGASGVHGGRNDGSVMFMTFDDVASRTLG